MEPSLDLLNTNPQAYLLARVETLTAAVIALTADNVSLNLRLVTIETFLSDKYAIAGEAETIADPELNSIALPGANGLLMPDSIGGDVAGPQPSALTAEGAALLLRAEPAGPADANREKIVTGLGEAISHAKGENVGRTSRGKGKRTNGKS